MNKVNYIPTTVVESAVGVQAVKIELIQEVVPTQVTFPLSSNLVLTPNTGGQSPVKIELPSGTCLEDASGNQVSGVASVYLNFFSPETDDFRQSPGLFLRKSTEEQLVSYGVFQLHFEDDVGNAVYPRPLSHTCGSQVQVLQESVAEVILSWPNVNAAQWPDYILWKLDSSGLWEELPAQTSNELIIGNLGPNDIGKQTMLTIGLIEENPVAYAKIRVFTDSSLSSEVTPNTSVSYHPDILLLVSQTGIPPMSAIHLFSVVTTAPATVCHEVRLSSESSFLRASVSIDRFISGAFVPTIPVALSNYPTNIQGTLSSLNYVVNENEISVDAQTGDLFHPTKTACDSADITSPALWFTL